MNIRDIQKAYPRVPEDIRQRLILSARNLKEEEPVKKKITLSVALVAALVVLLAASAVAMTIKNSVAPGYPKKYESKIVTIGKHYENDYFTLDINDAASDGVRMEMALDMQPKEGAGSVYVFPRLSATAKGQQLECDIESCYDAYDGIWMPERKENYAGPGKIILDALLMTEEEMSATFKFAKEDVKWTLTMHVLKPNWPVEVDGYTKDGFYDEKKIGHKDFMKLFEEAYKNKKILLSYGDTTVEYAAGLPTPEGMTQEEHMMMQEYDRLTQSGAFTEIETLTFEFSTPGNKDTAEAEQLPVFEKDGIKIALTKMTMTDLSGELQAAVTYKDGSSAGKHPKQTLFLEVRADGQALPEMSRSFGPSEDDAKAQRYMQDFSTGHLKALPKELTLVPYTVEGEGVNMVPLSGQEMHFKNNRVYDMERAVTVMMR